MIACLDASRVAARNTVPNTYRNVEISPALGLSSLVYVMLELKQQALRNFTNPMLHEVRGQQRVGV